MFEHFWAKPLLILLNVKLTIKGRDNLPPRSEPVLYLFNHSSFMDIPLLLLIAPHVYFGAKVDLFKVPVLGWAMQLYGALKIYRNKGGKTISMYKTEVSKRAALGDSFALAPEGGRKCTSKDLANFKLGPFLLSFFAQIPVVPVLIIGAHKLLPKSAIFFSWGRWKSNIEIQILPSQPVETYQEEAAGEFRDKIYQLMQENYVKSVQTSIKSI